jgi:hypothetical protein
MTDGSDPSAEAPPPAPQAAPPPRDPAPTEPVAMFDRGANSTAQPISIVTKTENQRQ